MYFFHEVTSAIIGRSPAIVCMRRGNSFGKIGRLFDKSLGLLTC